MDTDDLTPMAYECIVLAYLASDTLKAQLGAFANRYNNEEDYLKGILKYVKRIETNPYDYLDFWNFIDELKLSVFRKRITRLCAHIEKTIETPFSERGDLIEW